MEMQEIKEIAKKHHIKPHRLSKIELILDIQRIEGNFDCYGTASNNECDQLGCAWREDCIGSERLN